MPAAARSKWDMVRRKVLNVAAVASLALFVAMAALWVRALSVIDQLSWSRWTQHPLAAEDRVTKFPRAVPADVTMRNDRLKLSSWRGTLVFEYLHQSGGYGWEDGQDLAGSRWEWSHPRIDYGSTVWGDAWTGFGFRAGNPYIDPYVRYWSVPLWVPMGLCLIPPWVLLRRHVRERRRARAGRCRSCGYDLRATPDCCPECGSSTPTAASVLP